MKLFVPRSRLPKLSEDEFYIEDLKGMKLYTDMPETQDAVPHVDMTQGFVVVNVDFIAS